MSAQAVEGGFCMEKKAETKRHLKKQKSIQEEGARTDQPPETSLRFLQSPVFHFLCIAFIAFLSYSNSFHVPFSFDDAKNIVESPYVRDIGLITEPLKHYSGTLPYGSRYIGYLTFALNYKFHGFHVTGFHMVNLLIHLFNALLVYLFVLYTFRTPFLNRSALKDRAGMIAFFSGLLFVSHPLQTQAVTYIVQRLASLAGLFYLLSVVLYIKWRLILQDTDTGERNTVKKNWAHNVLKALLYMASVLSAVFAMKTKEIAFTLPFMIILYEFLFFHGPLRKRVKYLVPIMTTVLIIPLGLIKAHKTAGTVFSHIDNVARMQTDLPRWDYLVTQFRVIVTYIRLLIFPANQNIDYDYPTYHSLLTPQVFLSFMLLLFIGGIGIYLLYRYRNTSPQARIISFGIFWFFITLSVESSIVPIVDVIFEHRLYLPSMGVFISVIVAIYWISNKFKVRWKNTEKITAILLVSIILIFSGATYARNEVWQNNIRLWEDTVSKSPAKARPYYNLGKAFEDKGLYDKALEQFYIALKLNPDDGTSYYHVGNAYLYKGLFDKAIEQYQVALKFMPDNAISHFNLGNAYYV